MTDWTTPADVRARARRRWDDGSVLAAYVRGEPCPVLDFPVRGPGPRQIGPDLARVRAWQEGLLAGAQGDRAYTVTMREVGGRAIGRMRLPGRVTVSTYGQFWRLLSVRDHIDRLDRLLAATRPRHDPLIAWVAGRATTAIELAPSWPTILAALDWLAAESGRGRYLREVSAAGVDTKFIERHQGVLAELLDVLRRGGPLGPDDRAGSGSSPGRTFAARAGFREPERLVQCRLDPALGALPGGIDELALPLRHLRALAVRPQRVVVVENRVTYLSVPLPERGVVVWGHGFDALRLGSVSWLGQCPDARYWGDIDTHGFAILNGLRHRLPGLRSVLMDRATLLTHRDRWVVEPRPTSADLTHLTPAEAALYVDLVEGVLGPALRLEQERVDWSYAVQALAALDAHAPPEAPVADAGARCSEC